VQPLVIVVGVTLLALLGGVLSYNRFVSQRNLIHDSWANVETELQRRYDLVPGLVDTVRGYAAHERAVFERVAQARAAAAANHGRPQEQARDENVLVDTLRSLFALAEGYPELQASRNFLALQRELTNTEDRIQAARRFYNGNVRDFNRRVEAIPSNVVATLLRFEREDYFQIDEAVRASGSPTVGGIGPGPGDG
jgi:LemA protein